MCASMLVPHSLVWYTMVTIFTCTLFIAVGTVFGKCEWVKRLGKMDMSVFYRIYYFSGCQQEITRVAGCDSGAVAIKTSVYRPGTAFAMCGDSVSEGKEKRRGTGRDVSPLFQWTIDRSKD